MQSTPIDRFTDFFQGYMDDKGKRVYTEQVQKMVLEGLTSLFIDYDDLLRYDPELARQLRENPEDVLKEANGALKEVLNIEDPIYATGEETFVVRFSNIPDQVDLRRVRNVHLGKLISVEGIILRQSVVKPLLIEGSFQCLSCGENNYLPQIGGMYMEPHMCVNPSCGKKGAFKLNSEESTYKDLQTITVQERPETLPPGQIPRNLPARLVGDLVDAVRAGDRAIVSGILRMKSPSPSKKGKLAIFDLWLEVNYVSSQQKEYEEIEIDPETEKEIIELSRDLSVHRRIIRSVAPSIYGMETIKEAIATILFGGESREAPDGMKQRGESNLLVIGDPGVAKSQILQFACRLAPRGLMTSGKASTAAGLTAAVIRDQDTGEFTLEAGALVLGDRGVVAIDEFDKMNKVDRSSIHEAMEQQSYHPSFEIMTSNGNKERIGPYVDNLFMENKNSKLDGKNCEILLLEHENLQILTTDFKEVFSTKVNRVSRHTSPDYFVKITYSNGRELLVTPEHPVYVYENGSILTKEADKIIEGDFAPGIRKLENKNSALLATNFIKGRKQVVLPDSISNSFVQFLGYYIAEGYSYSGTSDEVGLSNTDPVIIRKMKNCIFDTFGVEPIDNTRRNRTLRIVSTDIYNYLKTNFPNVFVKSYEKRIDKKLFCIDKEKRALFLQAAFEGDGSVESTALSYSTASRGLAEDYQDLLLTLQINSRILSEIYSFGKEKKEKRTRYKVYIAGDSIQRFTEIVLQNIIKSENLDRILRRNKKNIRHHDVLPTSTSLKIIENLHNIGLSYNGYFNQHIKNNYGITLDVIQKYLEKLEIRIKYLIDNIVKCKTLEDYRKLINYSITKMSKLVGLSRNTLSKHEKLDVMHKNYPSLLRKYTFVIKEQIKHAEKSIQYLRNLINFRWLRIKKVEIVENADEYKTDWVYDVTVEPTENFISHGLVLHNTISIAKAGIVAQLNARTAIIAAANPRFGRYEPSRSPGENINLTSTILSRFDLIFIIKDEPNVEFDTKMARHILELRRGHLLEEAEPPISMELLRKYISYSKQHVHPVLTDEAMERIEKYYLELRKESDGLEIAITPRYLEALVRLSESQARMALKNDVTIDHVEAAIRLLKTSLEQAGKDPISGKVTVDYMVSGMTSVSRSKMDKILDIIKDEITKSKYNYITMQKLKEIAKEIDIEEDFVEKVIEQLQKSGQIFTPKEGRISFT